MNKELKYNTIVWIGLVLLILLTYSIPTYFSHSIFLLGALSAFKFLSVLFQFVELKNAHLLWKIVGIFFVVCYLMLCLLS